VSLGRTHYTEAHRIQQELVTNRSNENAVDTLLFVEHEHVFTRGRKSRDDTGDLVAPGDVPVVNVERGGEVTYHGPGQLVAYPIVALVDGERDAPGFIRKLEQWVILALQYLELRGGRTLPGVTGVWYKKTPEADLKKMASIGVAVTAKWITWHGVAVNVATDMSYFERINPCGLKAAVMTRVNDQSNAPITLAEMQDALIAALPEALGRRPVA
jgi:lipoyl(octanoyl) transferase